MRRLANQVRRNVERQWLSVCEVYRAEQTQEREMRKFIMAEYERCVRQQVSQVYNRFYGEWGKLNFS